MARTYNRRVGDTNMHTDQSTMIKTCLCARHAVYGHRKMISVLIRDIDLVLEQSL